MQEGAAGMRARGLCLGMLLTQSAGTRCRLGVKGGEMQRDRASASATGRGASGGEELARGGKLRVHLGPASQSPGHVLGLESDAWSGSSWPWSGPGHYWEFSACMWMRHAGGRI